MSMAMVTNYLNKAKKYNKVIDFKHIKILLTGPSAAGKSSFCHLLFGSKKFSTDYKSTDILESKQAVIKQKPIAVKTFTASKQEGEINWYELDPTAQIQFLKSLLVHKRFHDQKYVDDVGGDKPEGSHSIDDDDDEEGNNNDNTPPEASQSDLVKKVVKAESLPDSFTSDIKLVTVVDTGGQPEYIHLLPAINSYPTVTFIVHDLNEKLHEKVNVYREVDGKKVKERILNFTYLNMIHLLMCFVTDTLEQQLPEQAKKYISSPIKPYIGFVGTHYDEVKDPAIIKNIIDSLNLIVTEREYKPEGILHSEEIGNIHLVNNKTAGDGEKEDSAVKEIREQIEEFTNEIEPRILPITWMILQLKIQEKSNEKPYISYEEYKKIVKETINDDKETEEETINADEEIEASLTYFHFTGILLYFKHSDLCNYIVINLQWLYSNLAKVMQLSSKNIKYKDSKVKNKLDNQRLLVKQDYKCKLEGIDTNDLNLLLNLLKHLKVIAEVTKEDVEYFYLPCALSNSEMCGRKYNKHGKLLSEPLLIQFKSGFLPRGFFCSLVVHLINDQHKTKWKDQLNVNEVNYSDLMIFLMPDGSYLYMHDKIFFLQLEMRCSESGSSLYHKDIFFKLYTHYLEAVCKHLRFDPQKLQYGFLCKANQCDDDHIVVIDLPITLRSMEDKSRLCIQCNRKGSEKILLEKCHTIWFEQVSIYIF